MLLSMNENYLYFLIFSLSSYLSSLSLYTVFLDITFDYYYYSDAPKVLENRQENT